VPEYVFTVRSFGGPELGTDLKEFDWTLQVDSKRSMVAVETYRSDADVPGTPVGVFRYVADDVLLRDFHGLITQANLGQLKPAMQGHPGYTERIYTVVQPQQRDVQQRINNSDEATNGAIAPLRLKINSMLGQSFNHPERAVKTEVRLAAGPQGDRFEVSVFNIGVERVVFADPRGVVSTGPLQRAAVMLAEYPESRPGDPPPFFDWKEIPLESLSPRPGLEPLVMLDAGGTWKAASAGFKRAPRMRYLAYFTWANYVGSPMADTTYRIRGRVDSPRIVINP
jgi:hypothetical protein